MSASREASASTDEKAAQPTGELQMHELKSLMVSSIRPNDENPRQIFTEEELKRLSASIETEGILVPVVVVPDDQTEDRYVLVDGERRWKCARELGLERIPAVIAGRLNKQQNLLHMFNIHMVREPWEDMPTAWALEKVIAHTGIESDRDLSDLTGVSVDRIRRLKHALALPEEYQQYIFRREVPLNFFWELKQNVIEPLAKLRPNIWTQYGSNDILKAFVDKRFNETLTDTVSLRKVRTIINLAAREADEPGAPSLLDQTLRNLIDDRATSIDEAYSDSVEMIVEADKLERRTANMLTGFERLLKRANDDTERENIRRIGRNLINALSALIKKHV
jgi:ParB family transcriptional regulator, chromosome partitioning protein